MNEEVRNIPIDSLIEPRVVLRMVDRGSTEFMELCDSIRAHGILNGISARPAKQDGKYEIIEGNHRFNAAKFVGLTHIPCIVLHGISDDDVLALQIQAQACRVETKPSEFAAHIKKMMSRHPELTIPDVARLLKKSPKWIGSLLNLLKLPKQLQPAIDRGDIPLGNAYLLCKLPPSAVPEFVDRAKILTAREFSPLVAAYLKQFKEAVKQGKMEAFWNATFSPQAYLRPLREVQHELNKGHLGPLLVVSEKCETALDGFRAALMWVAHLDRRSVEEQERAVRARSRKKEKVYRETELEKD